MVTLGLAPPYVQEDVKRAYFEKAKRAHPDHGGNAVEFTALHTAFQQATEFIEFRGDRRAWIAAKMERYVALERAAVRLEQLGARVILAVQPWLERSFGDFAQLTESPAVLRAMDAANGDELLAALVEEHDPMRDLEAIELPGCRVTDDAVLRLGVFKELRRLNLANTPVTRRVLALVEELPLLETFALDGTNVGWWSRRRTTRRLKQRALE